MSTTPASGPTERPLALVTGASSGIGLHLSRELVQRGYDLVVCAEDDELVSATAQLRASGADVQAHQCDLRDPAAVEELYAVARDGGRRLDVAALNAGVGRGGPFVENDLADEQSVIDLNISSTVHLAKLVLRDMVTEDHGRVLVTSSVAAEMPGAHQAVYNASKSFLQSFVEALQAELAGTSVTLTSLMPGPTETEFFARARMLDTRIGRSSKDDPARVAAQGVDALLAGRRRVTGGGLSTRAQDLASRVVPDPAKAAMHRFLAKPGSAR